MQKILLLALCLFPASAFARGGGTQVGAWKCQAQGVLGNGAPSKIATGQGMTRPSAEQSALGLCQSGSNGLAYNCKILSCK